MPTWVAQGDDGQEVSFGNLPVLFDSKRWQHPSLGFVSTRLKLSRID